MISLDEALLLLEKRIQSIQDTESISLRHAQGRILADDISAPCALPPFTNTGVDGYAIRHEIERTNFNLIGASYAGEPFRGELQTGQAVRIATGAILPVGADTVVMQEYCSVNGNILNINTLPSKGANLRMAGGDVGKGDIAVTKGQELRPVEMAFLAALNIHTVKVLRPLRVAILSTGTELLQHGEDRQPGKIFDTNADMLMRMLSGPQVIVTCLPPLPDDYDSTKEALTSAAENYDVIITTGGVSVGDKDFIRDVLHDHGEIIFWKLAIRPGKPVLLGKVKNCVMLALPGNPVSANITCLLIGRAVLSVLSGGMASLPEAYTVILAENIAKPETLRTFSRARYYDGKALPYTEQASNLYTSLVHADGILDLPAGRSEFFKDEQVLFRPYSSF